MGFRQPRRSSWNQGLGTRNLAIRIIESDDEISRSASKSRNCVENRNYYLNAADSATRPRATAAAGVLALDVRRCRRYGRFQSRYVQGIPAKLREIFRKTFKEFPRGPIATGRKSERVGTIYKICPASAWREAERQGVYRGSADDQRDGFIHFSTASQVAETARRHFFRKTGLFLIAVDADALGDALRWEVSRANALFPHLYGELDLGAVTAVMDLHARSDGHHDIPELEP